VKQRRPTHGFTLVEVIVTIIVAGLFAALLLAQFDLKITDSHEPLQRMQASEELSNAMEAIVKDYDTMTAKSTSDMALFTAKVNNFSTAYSQYAQNCTAAATTLQVGELPDAVLVTVTHNRGEKVFHVFTVQSY